MESCIVTAGTIDGLAAYAGLRRQDVCAAHEAALQLLGLDNNVIPYGVDVIVGRAAYRTLDLPEAASGRQAYKMFPEGEVPTRIWESRGLLRHSRLTAGVIDSCGIACLRPRRILEALPQSPDFPYLREQYARLAEVLFFDDMTDEQLSQFLRYVRD